MWEVQAPGVASCVLGLEENLGSSEQVRMLNWREHGALSFKYLSGVYLNIGLQGIWGTDCGLLGTHYLANKFILCPFPFWPPGLCTPRTKIC